jgi:Leucine-rich repeat (LRR) protein
MMAFMTEPSTPHLDLSKKGLVRVPDWVWEQSELEALMLADNELVEVSEQIGCPRKLHMLDLGHNRLTTLLDALADLNDLTDFLYLHDNQLTSLPPRLNRLRKLRYLNISANTFEVLPEWVCVWRA